MTPVHSRLLVSLCALASVCFLATRDYPVASPHFITRATTPKLTSTATPLPSASTSANADPAACLTPGTTPTASFAAAVAAKNARAAALAATAAFTDWLTAWRRSDPSAPDQPALATTGRELAVARRAALKHLIETDPRRALELAVPVGLRSELPADIQAQLERRIDARGALDVSIYHVGAEARYERLARVDGETFRAFVFGRRDFQPTKTGLPLHGIALDDVLALDETPYRLLDDTERRVLTPTAPTTGASDAPTADAPGSPTTALLVGDRLTLLSTPAEFTQLADALTAAESAPGPQVTALSSLRSPPAPASAASGSPGAPNTPDTAAVTSPPSWINGVKRVLWLKIDFADDTGAAFTDAEITAGATGNNDFYLATSQNKTSFTPTILPSVLRMPKNKSYYDASGSTNGELYLAAHDAAKVYDAANGNTGAWDPDKFDRYIIVHKRMAVYLYGGVAQLGGPRVGLNNTVSAGTIGHELGHTQSLAHSHYWLPTGTSAVGAGSHIEYGDVFDLMGGGGATQTFNLSQKSKLGYLDATSIATVTAAGTYRINRHDDKDATGLRGLKIAPADLGYEYWIEHRRTPPTSFNAAQTDRFRNGVLIHWGAEKSPKFTTGAGTYLLDATPGSAGGANDAPLRIGESFVDPDAGLTIKPLAVGGAAPNEYIDVQVGFGAIDGNRNPTLLAEAPAGSLNARTNIVFNATGSDPDGDSIYYRWDFGDGSFQPNLGSITRRFTKGGTYSLRVSAHDGKGGIAIKNISLTVADPLIAWTQRGAGVTTNQLNDVIYAGSQFVAVGINQTVLTSPDGTAWTRGTTFPSGNSLTGIAHSGARYVMSGYRFSNTTQKGLAAYSTDAVTWTLVPLDTGLAQFWGVAYGVGRFVMVGDNGLIYSSGDGGATWTAANSGITTTLRAVTFADGLFVATGDNGRLFTSTDGLAWTNRSLPTTAAFWGSTKHNGLWVTRAGVTIYTSPDGATWTRVTPSGATNIGVYKTQSIGGVLLTGMTNGGIDFGENAQTWATVQVSTATGANFRATAASDRTIVTVGNSGLIYATSLPTSSSPPLPAPALRLAADSIKVAVGKKNVLAASGAGFVKLELYANGSKVSELSGSSGALSWTPTAIGNYLLTVRGIDATGASVVSAAYPAVAAFANWQWLNPTPVGADLRGAVRVDGKWWIVGGGGTLLTLDDAGNFTAVDFPTTQSLNAIAYANGRFVIATYDIDGATKEDIGALWTSTDGYTWTPFLTGALDSANLNTVLYAANRWIALGTGGTVVTSTDGLNWPRASSGVSNSFTGATIGQGLIVAVAAGGRILTSPDGLAWTAQTSGVTTDLRGVTFANGTFVAVGNSGVILTSPDGLTWTRPTSGVTANLYGVAFVKGSFVVGGDNGTLLNSATAATWAAVSLNGNLTGTLYLAGTPDEGLLVGRGGDIYAATTATSWRRLNQGSVEAKQAVLYAGGRWIAVGSNTDTITRATIAPIQVSTDGLTWTRAAANSAFAPLTAVAYGQSRYVAVGPNSAIFTSTDALTWTSGTANAVAGFTCIAAGPNLFVAASSGAAIYSSPTGTAWTQRAATLGGNQNGAAYGAGRFVVVGVAGAIRHSTDGTTWTVAPSGTTANLLAVGYWDDVGFIATGANGTILNSPDGLAWQQRESGVAENLGAIARTPIGFVAAGGTQGTTLVSLDGVSWSISALPVDKTIRGLAASSSAIVAVGDNGAMLAFSLADTTPAPVIVAQPVSRPGVAGDSVRFTVSAQNAAGAVYQWQKDGVPLLGANSPVFTIASATPAHAGAYTVTITSPTGVTTSAAANLSFGAVVDPGRLINLSILTALTDAADSFSFGVVVGGANTSGGKALLVRAVGPSLGALGVGGTLDDPKLEFYTGPTKVGENDNWGGSTAISTTMAQVGAFAFSAPTSKDAAIALPSLASGANSAKISGTGAGTVIAELYDATPAAAFTATTPRLINVSVLKNIGTGVTAGFVIGGSTPRTVLVRAIGPTLGGFGVGGTVADPRLALFSGQTQIGANDNWGGGTALAAAFAQVGAFALAADSRDAALLQTLQPGAYTVQVSSVDPAVTGTALVEVYEVP